MTASFLRIAIASDHAGFELKQALCKSIPSKSILIEDLGANSPEVAVDYPDYAAKVTAAVLSKQADLGILICGTGLGMCYAANRRRGIRAALVTSSELARMAAAHNNANVLCLGGRTTTVTDALSFVKTWLATPFEGGRHQKRIDLLDK